MAIPYVIKLWIVLALGLMVSTIWPIYESEGEGQPQEASPEKSQAVDPHIPDLQTSGGPKDETASDEHKSEETILVEQLRARSKELEKRAQRVQEEEQRIDALRRDLEALAKQQAKVAEEVAAALEAEKSKGKEDPAQKSLAHLLKVYEAMDPDEAALSQILFNKLQDFPTPFSNQGNDGDLGRSLPANHTKQDAFAYSAARKNAEPLPISTGQQGINRPDAQVHRLSNPRSFKGIYGRTIERVGFISGNGALSIEGMA